MILAMARIGAEGTRTAQSNDRHTICKLQGPPAATSASTWQCTTKALASCKQAALRTCMHAAISATQKLPACISRCRSLHSRCRVVALVVLQQAATRGVRVCAARVHGVNCVPGLQSTIRRMRGYARACTGLQTRYGGHTEFGPAHVLPRSAPLGVAYDSPSDSVDPVLLLLHAQAF